MTVTRLSSVMGLEFRATLRRPIWWVLVLGAAFTVLSLSSTAFLPQGSGRIGSPRPYLNSQYALTAFFGLSGFVLYSFFASVLAGLSVIRDDEHEVGELIHSTPLTAAEYVSGKFLGVLGALLLVLVIQIGLLTLFYEGLGGGDQVAGPFSWANYAVPAVFFGVVPVVVFSSLSFAVGEWTRKPMVVYAVPVLIVFALPFFVTWSPPWLSPVANHVLMVLDPSGMRWLIQNVITEAPGVGFVNTEAVAFDSIIWTNRIGLLAFSATALLSTVPHARKVIARGGVSGRSNESTLYPSTLGQEREPTDVLVERRLESSSPRLAPLAMSGALPGFWRTAAHSLSAELRELLSHPPLYLFIALLVGQSVEDGTSAFGPFEDRQILTAGSMSVSMLGVLTFSICAVLLFFTVESLHRDRVTRFESILYATPARTGALLLGKSLCGAVLVVILIGAATISSLTQLLIQGAGKAELAPMALVWGLVLAPTLVLWNGFVTAVWTVVRERYTTYAIGVSALLITLNTLQHSRMTWVYNWTAVGTLRWSDMGTFSLNGEALLWNRLLVLALAGTLFGLAVKRFPRVSVDAGTALLRFRPRRLLGSAVRILPGAIICVGLAAMVGFKVHTGFQGDGDRQRARDYWRQNVRAWADYAPPSTTHVDIAVDLNPRARRIAVDGTYAMFNATDASIEQLAFTTHPIARGAEWTVAGEGVDFEDRSGLHVLALLKPLNSGDSLRVGFSYEGQYPEGFTRNGGGVSQFVLPSGVVLHTLRNSFLPTPGFVEGIGVTADNHAEPAPVAEAFWREQPQPLARPYSTRVEITAPSEYTMNSVGKKSSETTLDSTTTVIWESDDPLGAINIVGGRWEVARRGSTAVFYHPEHDHNSLEILDALVAARTRYSEWFYPYPWEELKLNEYPNLDANAMGFPTNISFSESLGFLSRSDAKVPTGFVVTAHEAAHQWWGNILSAATGPGTTHLVEGMASYSALLLLQSELGEQSRTAHAKQLEESYLQGRDVDTEKPVARTTDGEGPNSRAVIVDKGAWVQWMLQRHLGREEMLIGLQAFIDHYVQEGTRPALQHMLSFLRQQSRDPDEFDAFVNQWFFDVVLPEFELTNVSLATVGGAWEVSATVTNVGTGYVDVDVSATRGRRYAEAGTTNEYKTASSTVRLGPGAARPVLLKLDFEPTHLVVDPDVQVLQRNRKDASLAL